MVKITEGNKLIAEFMGVRDCPNRYDKPGWEYWVKGNWWTAKTLRYDCLWDWIMPVVDKIETLHQNNFCIHSTYFSKREVRIHAEYNREFINIKYAPTKSSKIEATHSAVVEFIKWYNESIQS